MQIIGHGIDIVSLSRLRKMEKHGVLIHWKRAFTARELTMAASMDQKRSIEYLASNFAVKEATYKAAGGVPTREVSWQEIEVSRSASGQPTVSLYGEFAAHCRKRKITSWSVSISRSSTHAIGSVIAVSG